MLKLSIAALFAIAMFAGLGTAYAASFDPVVCSIKTDAEAIVASGVAEESMEINRGETTIVMIKSKLAAGACSQAEDLNISTDDVDFSDAADGIKLGVAQVDGRFAVVVDGILDF